MASLETLLPSELDGALPLLLGSAVAGRLADPGQVAAFREYLAESTLGWEGWRCGAAEMPSALFLAVLLAGRTTIIITPAPGLPGIVPDDQWQVTVEGLARLRERSLHYAQALLEPGATGQRELLMRAGFRPLAPLTYLERDALYPWVDPPARDEAEWVHYDARTHADFARVIPETYRDSRDCPELSGLRPIDDVLRAHQAAGRFDPRLWEVARVAGQDAACLLLTRLARDTVLDVVYMGVVPAWRRRGVGALLLRRALAQCRARNARRLTVVVDERNAPAARLYERFGFVRAAQREAYLYRWR